MFSRTTTLVVLFSLIFWAHPVVSRGADDKKDDEALRAALDRTMSVRFDKISIDDAIQFLRETTGQNIFVNWAALKTMGIDKSTTKVSLDLQRVKFSKVLNVMLEQIAAGKLWYTEDGDVIEVSTPEAIKAATTLPSHVAATQPGAIDKQAQAILDKRLPSVKFDNIALADAIQFLREDTGSNMVVDWKVLETAGIDKTTVSADLRNVKFSKVLDVILDSAGNGKLDYKVDDGVIAILTVDEINHKETPVYLPKGANFPADREAILALDRVMPAVKFDNVSIADTIQFLRETTHQNIVVDWKALEAAGIDKKTTQITLELRNAKFSRILMAIVDQAGAGKLSYAVDKGVVIVSTTDELEKIPRANQPAN